MIVLIDELLELTEELLEDELLELTEDEELELELLEELVEVVAAVGDITKPAPPFPVLVPSQVKLRAVGDETPLLSN